SELPNIPRTRDEPLRWLFLRGAAHAPGGGYLKLDQEAALIESAWEALPLEVQQLMPRPRFEPARRATLSSLIRDARPHVLWFSGHGRVDPSPQLLFEDGAWVSAIDLQELIRSSGWSPLYGVLAACNSGRESKTLAGVVSSPQLFSALQTAGLSSVLLVQSPIADTSAQLLAH